MPFLRDGFAERGDPLHGIPKSRFPGTGSIAGRKPRP